MGKFCITRLMNKFKTLMRSGQKKIYKKAQPDVKFNELFLKND